MTCSTTATARRTTIQAGRTVVAFTDPQRRSSTWRHQKHRPVPRRPHRRRQHVYVLKKGEKDVLAIEAAGGVAVCSAMGAGKAHKADWSVLKDKHAVINADKDQPGRDHATQVAGLLDGIATSVQIVEAAVGKDAADHIAAGQTLDEFVDAEWCNHGDELPDHESPLETQVDSGHCSHRRAAARRRPQAVPPIPDRRQRITDTAGVARRMDALGDDALVRTRCSHLRSEIYDTLGEVDYKHPIREKGFTVDHEIRPWYPDKHKVANVIEAHRRSRTYRPISTRRRGSTYIARRKPARGKSFHVRTGCWTYQHARSMITPRRCSTSSPCRSPSIRTRRHLLCGLSSWLRCGRNDPDSIALLQEYVGYVLSGRTDMQKLLLLIGPTRSGKGTIARMLTELIGRGHAAGPTLASLGTNFGLSPLLGKPLAIISDARLGETPAHTVVERLLSITGEDMLTVDRKYREPWSGKLPTRFVVLSNELPRFKDSSGAIANRLLILQMTESFLGREDRTLDERLRVELPGILAWALEGLDRLVRDGRFTVPGSSEDAAHLMMDLASPVSAFVRDCCVRGPGDGILADRLYDAWKRWAEDNGHHAGAKSTFGRNLRAVVPGVKMSQPRVGGGGRERRYERIALRACNAEDPVPPVPDAPGGAPDGPGTGSSRANATVNAQVNGHGTGGTGESPLWSQHEDAGTGSGVLFPDDPCQSTNGEVRKCRCGNPLPTPEGRGSGKCKPCRDKVMEGYDQ